jgi:hypothetical protein
VRLRVSINNAPFELDQWRAFALGETPVCGNHYFVVGDFLESQDQSNNGQSLFEA